MQLDQIVNFIGKATESGTITVTLISIGLAIISGLLLRITLSFVNQRWITTYHHTMTCMFLPVITFVVTKVIAGNIALSLGMIGALSIVRFRNPVRNPFELSVYFALITTGIAYAVRINYGILLIGTIILIVIFAYFLEKLFSKWGMNIYSLSFDEGINSHYLEVVTSKKIAEFDSHPNLIQYLFSKINNQHNYSLAFRTKEEVLKTKENIKDNEDIQSIETRFSN